MDVVSVSGAVPSGTAAPQGGGDGPERQRLMPAGHWDWPMAVPLSQGWRVGDLIFVGGQVSADEQGRPIGDDIATQTRNAFRALERVLAEAGATMNDVVKMTTFYRCDGEGEELQRFWEDWTRVRMEFLPDPGPASTAIRVSGFIVDGLLIEVEAIAVVPRREAGRAEA